MTRQDAHPRTPPLRYTVTLAGRPDPVRPSAAAPARRLGRILLAPFAALAAAAAGLLYVVLLPICGIASIASAVASASWAFLREAAGGAHRRAAPRT